MPLPDNKKVVGPLDREWVATDDPVELRDFVDAYLKSRNYAVAEEGRSIVKRDALAYPGRPPVSRALLVAHLDKKYQKAA